MSQKKTSNDIMQTIKKENPIVFEILKEQNKIKWEVTNADTYRTSNNASEGLTNGTIKMSFATSAFEIIGA
ncbi:MAG: hypothetical protein HW421_2556 [Ignavibacteria bacterium]|nr:hypothetical protein [Ignavibacteria bacterium]